MMRFYSPKAGLFDGTWKLPDVELHESNDFCNCKGPENHMKAAHS